MKHLILFFLSFLMLCPTFGQAQVFTIDKAGDGIWLNEYLSVLELDSEEIELSDAASGRYNDQFLPYQVFIKKYLPASAGGKALLDPDKVYWWRLSLQNGLGKPIEDWVLHLGRSNETEVFVLNKDGTLLSTHHVGWLIPAGKKDHPMGNRHDERISFSLGQDSMVTLFGKMTNVNKKEPYLALRLTQEDFYENWKFIEKTRLDWAFIGLLIAFILINFLLYASTHDRAFFWHALFQTCLFAYLLEFFNVLPELPLLRDNRIALQVLVYAMLCLMDVAYMQFIRRYMRMRATKPVWDRYFSRFEVARVLFALGIIAYYLATLNMKLSDDLTALFIVGQYSTMAVLLSLLFGKKDKKSLFLIAGTALFVAGVVLNAISVMQGTGIQFSYTQFGVVGEVILFTLGLGYRMKVLQKEELESQRLKDLDDFKTRFYTNITHEFRTPLTVIMGNSEIGKLEIEKTDFKTFEPKISQFLISNFDSIARNAAQLLRLVNRLLDLSKLQSGKMGLNLRQGDVAAFLRYVVEAYQSLAKGKDIHLHFLSEMEHFHMDFDAEKLQDVLGNLLSNAVKFSPPGSEVWVKCKAISSEGVNEAQLLITVKDNGPGIAEEALAHIFDRFFQADRPEGQGLLGSGVGLSLAKELVELMGGNITAESRPGTGAVFNILLPVSRSAPAMEPNDPVQISPIETVNIEPLQPAEHAQENSEKPLCLVVDDHADVVNYLKMLLENDYAISIAYDGQRGIEKALEMLPDVIISDVMMPEKDGLELCDFLKNDERTSHIPIILLTAKASVEDRLEGLRRGADAYLQKPFNQAELFICLQKSVVLRSRLLSHFSKIPKELGATEQEPALAMEDAFLQKARLAVEKKLADDGFDVHHLCRDLGMSRAQLHRKLTALTGKSTSHFIRSIRLQKAAGLLATTSLTVAEIAYEVGFRDPNYFSRTYSEEFGKAPSGSRKGD